MPILETRAAAVNADTQMNEYPTVETLFRQASMTAHTYFHEAIEYIDKAFGEGYAEAHPELVGAFMRTAGA
jgi:hypothetical protein